MSSCSEGLVPADCAAAAIRDINQANEGVSRLKDLLKDELKYKPTVEKIMDGIIKNLSSGLSKLEYGKAESDPGPTVRGGSVCSDDRKSEISSGKRKAVPIPASDRRSTTRRRYFFF